jgi:LacI family transcriptional regulator
MRKMTMRDISQATGLSMFTVSRALNGGEGVAEDTRAQIMKIAREVGYIPNRAAQALRRGTRDTIAVITASSTNSYYLEMLAGIQQALRPSHWTVVVGDVAVDGAYDSDLEDRLVQRLIEARAAGVISTLTLKGENLSLLASWNIPVVFVDSSPPTNARDFPSVTTDNYAASRMVGDHLAQHAYLKWLFLLYPTRWSTRLPREHGLRDAAQRHGATLTVLESDNDPAGAHRALAHHLEKNSQLPDVLIAGNNPILLGAMKLIKERQIRIPQDMALVGYDEFPWSELVDPPLTLLNEHSEQIGRNAAFIMTEIITARDTPERVGGQRAPIYLPRHQRQVTPDLVIRRSCGCEFTHQSSSLEG